MYLYICVHLTISNLVKVDDDDRNPQLLTLLIPGPHLLFHLPLIQSLSFPPTFLRYPFLHLRLDGLLDFPASYVIPACGLLTSFPHSFL